MSSFASPCSPTTLVAGLSCSNGMVRPWVMGGIGDSAPMMLMPSATASSPLPGQVAAESASAANCRWQKPQVAAPMNSTTGLPSEALIESVSPSVGEVGFTSTSAKS